MEIEHNKAKFITSLVAESLQDGTWQLASDLVYYSKIYDNIIKVPTGWITDLASVPRSIPIVYAAFGDRAHHESVIHDRIYWLGNVKRKLADDIFLEAMICRKKPWWIRQGMYCGVRLFGWKAWKNHRKLGHPKEGT